MTDHETALAEIRAALAFYANEWLGSFSEAGQIGYEPSDALIADHGDQADAALALLSTLSPEPATPEDADRCTYPQCDCDPVMLALREGCMQGTNQPAAKADDLVEITWRAVRKGGGAIGLGECESREIARAVLTAIDIPRREAEAAEREREECAKIAKNIYGGRAPTYSGDNAQIFRVEDATCARISAAIRARSQPAAKAQGGEE